MDNFFNHPYVSAPFATLAATNPWWMDPDTVLSRIAAFLGIIYLVMLMYYLYKNKGKK